MSKFNINSKRTYKVITLNPTNNPKKVYVGNYILGINTILNSEDEVSCAIQDILDDVLDIPIGCSMNFQPNRDNVLSRGIIYRLN